MKFSVITPTSEREDYLKGLYQTLLEQKRQDWQWLIGDDSEEKALFFEELKDDRVSYFHDRAPRTIGEKRNFLKGKAKGNYIVHFDDDDYYAPNYLTKVEETLQEVDFMTLSSWYCYHEKSSRLFYWKTDEVMEEHFLLHPLVSDVRTVEAEEKWGEAFQEETTKGFGFSYAYRKEVGEEVSFDSLNFGEDFAFFKKVEERGFKIDLSPDLEGLALHVVHDRNTSWVAPQYQLPSFLTPKLFPFFKKIN